MRSPDSVLLVTGLYLLVVKYGPSFMADKQPVRATGLMVIYNFFMVGLSLYMFFEVSLAVLPRWSLKSVIVSGGRIALRCVKQAWIVLVNEMIYKLVTFFEFLFFKYSLSSCQIEFCRTVGVNEMSYK